MTTPEKLTIDCAAWGARAFFDEASGWQVEAEAARELGDDPRANVCARNAESCRTAGRNALIAAGLPDAETIEPESRTPLTDEEMVQRGKDEAEALEATWSALRARRDALLAASDWTQLPGAPITAAQKKRWDAYRQALRDLPAGLVTPQDPQWPEPPG